MSHNSNRNYDAAQPERILQANLLHDEIARYEGKQCQDEAEKADNADSIEARKQMLAAVEVGLIYDPQNPAMLPPDFELPDAIRHLPRGYGETVELIQFAETMPTNNAFEERVKAVFIHRLKTHSKTIQQAPHANGVTITANDHVAIKNNPRRARLIELERAKLAK